MSDTTVDVTLDPAKVAASVDELVKEFKNLSSKIEESLGKEAPKNIKKLEDAAENGTNRLTKMFRNMGQRIREDLKTAFDATGVLAGAKFASEIGKGVKSVFDMEQAFNRLNTRLKLSNDELLKFKKAVGTKVSATGQKIEDVLPGVETAAARGGVKSTDELADIAEALGKSKQITGEGTEGLAESVVKILQNRGEKVTAESFKKTLDALEGTRSTGNFKTATEAGQAVSEITGVLTKESLKAMGLGTREIGGLAAIASKSGEGGIGVMRKILETGQTAGGRGLVNSIFGSQVFQGEKLNIEGLKGINKNNLGQFSSQSMAQVTGLDQAELSRWIDSFKQNTDNFREVTAGADETNKQFEQASKGLGFAVQKFREQAVNAGHVVGMELSAFGDSLLHGKWQDALHHAKDALNNAWENKGAIGGTLAASLGVGVLAGGGLNRILKKVPGGGLAGHMLGAEAAKATGATPVYVVNAAEIGGGMGGVGAAGAAGGFGGKVGALGGGLAIGAAIGEIMNATGMTDLIGNTLFGSENYGDSDYQEKKAAQEKDAADAFNKKNNTHFTPDQMKKAIIEAFVEAKRNERVMHTNPSSVRGRN